MTISTKTVRRWATEGFPDLEKAFDEWLSELIRKEREEAWDDGYSHCFDSETCSLEDNPYRKEQP